MEGVWTCRESTGAECGFFMPPHWGGPFPITERRNGFLGFFTAHVKKPEQAAACYGDACRFSEWCEDRGLALAEC
jgi:hypothetical protein